MNHEMLKEHLELAERHVSEGERHVARQRELVDKLEREGHDTSEPKRLLRQFEELLDLHIKDCERLRKELG